MTIVNEKIVKIINFIEKTLFEKEEAIRLSLLAIISKNPMLLISSPGIGRKKIEETIFSIFCEEINAKSYLTTCRSDEFNSFIKDFNDDQFLLFYEQERIQNKKSFFDMLFLPEERENSFPKELIITKEEILQWSDEIDNIQISEPVLELLYHLRNWFFYYHENSLYISDRRWKKILKLLKTSAFLDGRKEVDLADTYLIPFTVTAKLTTSETTLNINNLLAGMKNVFLGETNNYFINKEFKVLKNEIENYIHQDLFMGKVGDISLVNIGNKSFYQLEHPIQINNGELFELLAIEDFNKLEQKWQSMPLYGMDGKSKPFMISEGKKKNQLLWEVSSWGYKGVVELKIYENNTYQKRVCKPTDEIKNRWDKKIEDWINNLEKQSIFIKKQQKQTLSILENHTFIMKKGIKELEIHSEDIYNQLQNLVSDLKELKKYYYEVEESIIQYEK
ncbi:hypothetical protein JXR93_04540 [bacterium]|nr:hypothetical protein [bacterium]